MNMFRTLRADEIDCRIAQIKRDGSGLSLLLYKDARCDQNILDEVVGPYNWKREHTRDNRNCVVSIWDADKGQWIGKEDTGTESNTEREKGLASDSFKRACFNWGIGRELYTAPFIWVPADKCRIKDGKCYDRFTVKGIGYTDGVITGLEIKNQATGKICYRWGEINEEAPDKPEDPGDEPAEIKKDAPGTVETMAAVPENPVADYIRAEIVEIQNKLKLTYQDARIQVFAWADALARSGAIAPIDWKNISLDEAVNAFQAINETFHPGEKKGGRK